MSLNFESIDYIFKSNLGDAEFKTIRNASIDLIPLRASKIPAMCLGSLPCESPSPGVSIK